MVGQGTFQSTCLIKKNCFQHDRRSSNWYYWANMKQKFGLKCFSRGRSVLYNQTETAMASNSGKLSLVGCGGDTKITRRKKESFKPMMIDIRYPNYHYLYLKANVHYSFSSTLFLFGPGDLWQFVMFLWVIAEGIPRLLQIVIMCCWRFAFQRRINNGFAPQEGALHGSEKEKEKLGSSPWVSLKVVNKV